MVASAKLAYLPVTVVAVAALVDTQVPAELAQSQLHHLSQLPGQMAPEVVVVVVAQDIVNTVAIGQVVVVEVVLVS